jgi:hypothetical protein
MHTPTSKSRQRAEVIWTAHEQRCSGSAPRGYLYTEAANPPIALRRRNRTLVWSLSISSGTFPARGQFVQLTQKSLVPTSIEIYRGRSPSQTGQQGNHRKSIFVNVAPDCG